MQRHVEAMKNERKNVEDVDSIWIAKFTYLCERDSVKHTCLTKHMQTHQIHRLWIMRKTRILRCMIHFEFDEIFTTVFLSIKFQRLIRLAMLLISCYFFISFLLFSIFWITVRNSNINRTCLCWFRFFLKFIRISLIRIIILFLWKNVETRSWREYSILI